VVEPGTASEEKILVTRTGSTDTTINVASDSVRGQDGTSAVSHSSGSTVFPVFTSVDADEANAVASVISADTTNSRIGIGTATPAYKLDVKGQVQVGSEDDITPDAFGNGHLMIDGAAYTGFASLDSTAMWVGHNSNGRSLYLATDETARVTVTGVGNVGINDTSPSYKLDVNGDINATGDLRIGGTAIGTWTAYTPTLTNWTASTLGFEYARVNDLVFIKIYAVVATMGTIPTFSVPIPIGGTPNYQSMGILDSGAAWYQGNVLYNNSTSLNMWYLNSSGGAGIYGIITALAPFTWAPGDAFEGTIYYKAA